MSEQDPQHALEVYRQGIRPTENVFSFLGRIVDAYCGAEITRLQAELAEAKRYSEALEIERNALREQIKRHMASIDEYRTFVREAEDHLRAFINSAAIWGIGPDHKWDFRFGDGSGKSPLDLCGVLAAVLDEKSAAQATIAKMRPALENLERATTRYYDGDDDDGSELLPPLHSARAILASPAEKAPELWQPIETAPRGVKLLAGYRNELGKWRTITACYYLPETLESDNSDDGWAAEGWYEESETQDVILPCTTPTNWMPLPVLGHPAGVKAGGSDPEPKMQRISKVIADLTSIKERFGDTCVYIRSFGFAWGAVALNYQDEDKKNGVFDREAEYERRCIQHAEQVERLLARERETSTDLSAAQATIAKMREEIEWQPIGTAPTDGTHILIAFGSDYVGSAMYRDDGDDSHPWKFLDRDNEPILNGARDDKYGPTHWRHLPAPPTRAALASPAEKEG